MEDRMKVNLQELIRTYRTTGKIGKVKPSTLASARKAAFSSYRKEKS